MEAMTDAAHPATPIAQYNPRATRFEACRNDACLTWRESSSDREPEAVASEPPREFALLLDISQTGASIALDRIPQPDDGVRLRVDAPSTGDWTEAKVVGVTTTARGPHLVRLKFSNPCSFETLLAVICD